jgi:hypothetical protein
MATTRHAHRHAQPSKKALDDKHCRSCNAILKEEDVGLVGIECVKEASGIGFFFQNWCVACQDKFRDSGAADKVNTLLERFVGKARAKPRRAKKASS